MHCPSCLAMDTKVADSRPAGEGSPVRYRRQRLMCSEHFTIFEAVELVMPRAVKNNDMCKAFNGEKLCNGMLRVLGKRPVSSDDVEMVISRIKSQLRTTGECGAPSKTISNLVTEQLKKLDKVAHIRFTPTYRSFEGVKEFGEEIVHLED